jgi:hypothetical protein
MGYNPFSAYSPFSDHYNCGLRGLGGTRILVLKEHSPTRNQLPVKTHEENSKNSKTQNPHVLAVSMQGASSGKKEKRKNCGFGQPESLLRRRRVRFGKWTIPLRTHLDL